MATHAALGSAAIDKKDYPAAITHLTKALAETPTSPNYLILRSTAYQRARDHEAALADADAAVLAATARSRRELIGTAHFRRAVALHGLGRFGDARLCLNWCAKKNEKEKGLTIWQAKVKADYDAAGGEEAECNKCTVKEIPEKQAAVKVDKGKAPEKSAVHVSSSPVSAPASAPVATPKEKIRQEWFQSNSRVTITIFAKGVAKDTAQITIEEGQVEVSFPIGPTGTTYDFTASPLFAQIDPAQSKFNITPNKVEIDLYKSKQGLKWSSLEGTEPITSKSTEEKKSEIPAAILNLTAEKAPSYPTSSRKGPKDWDALASSALKSEKKEGDKETTGDDDDEDGDPMNAFFKKLYKGADPDTKRAMMKSFQESNGTALSTNWADVSKGPVETSPPDGVEAKKW
ncbi:Cochaperone protein [Ciborinia camelliae]|nr:Cochaperone protein [Ciborinia camelliae]